MSDRPEMLSPDQPLPLAARAARRAEGGCGAAMLGAAMVAVGEILEPEKANVEIAHPSDDEGDDGLDLDSGHLPNLG